MQQEVEVFPTKVEWILTSRGQYDAMGVDLPTHLLTRPNTWTFYNNSSQ